MVSHYIEKKKENFGRQKLNLTALNEVLSRVRIDDVRALMTLNLI